LRLSCFSLFIPFPFLHGPFAGARDRRLKATLPNGAPCTRRNSIKSLTAPYSFRPCKPIRLPFSLARSGTRKQQALRPPPTCRWSSRIRVNSDCSKGTLPTPIVIGRPSRGAKLWSSSRSEEHTSELQSLRHLV